MNSRLISRSGVVLLPVALALAACDLPRDFVGQASDEWTRRYTLAPGGAVEVANTNGLVDIEAVDGTTVDIRAERIARAPTDAAARELLSRLAINEDVTADRVSIETAKIMSSGFLMGAGVEVRYYVRAPKTAAVRVTTTNGRIAVSGVTGTVVARTTNGGLTGKLLGGAVDAASTNGSVNVEMAALGGDKVALRTTNGVVLLTLPALAKATLSASCTNGGIDLSGLQLTIREQSRRHIEASLNGGGTPIELRTTNGGIRVRTRT